MEENSGKSEEKSSKTIIEEESLKNGGDSSKNLPINGLISNNNKNKSFSQKKEEINKEILIITSNSQLNSEVKRICPNKNRYPFCIVWTPIPFLTYIFPYIGHTGIANSEGIIHDFAASFYVSIDDFSFGNPTKYYQLELSDKEQYEYDNAIQKGDLKYNSLRHNLFRNNCHSHVAYVLNQIHYKGKNNYNMLDIWWVLIWKGKYVSFLAFIKTYLGFFIFLLIIILALR